MLRRTAFRRPDAPPSRARVRQWEGPAPTPRAPAARVNAALPMAQPVPKEKPLRSEAYRRAVAALPCINCGIVGFSQAAHGPAMGLGIKASDAELFPLCCARPGSSGCHHLFDTYQLFDRHARAEWAKKWAKQTRARVLGHANATHGMSKTPTYIAWIEARKRCFNPQNERFHYYGGRGITMCARWVDSFENFLADMGERPAGLSLDRRDNNGHYEPGNCRWATQQEQVSNRRNCMYVRLDGERVTCAEAARRLGVTHNTVKKRLAKGLLPRWTE